MKIVSWISTLIFVISAVMYITYLFGFTDWESKMYTFWILGSFLGVILGAFSRDNVFKIIGLVGNMIVLVLVIAIPYFIVKVF